MDPNLENIPNSRNGSPACSFLHDLMLSAECRSEDAVSPSKKNHKNMKKNKK